ncbi:MAG: prenyltransferase/squalene oxidase repeat-containing protein [Kiritimatiellia bacterium]
METIDEEVMKERLEEEMAKYDEEGYFKRLLKMFTGLGRSRASREYKEAIIELQRQIAPLMAILIPLIGVIVLFVVTAVGSRTRQEIKVEIVQADQQEEQLEEVEPPPETEPPPDIDVEIAVDTPTVNPTEVAQQPAPTAEPQSVKVASVDAMLNIKSPVTIKSVLGTERGAGVRGTQTRGGAQYGDALTEAAVMKALRWLKATQDADGSWGTKPAFGLTKGMDKAAGCGFAVLTFLAHGETPGSKEFGPTVQKALDYLVKSVYIEKNKDGSLKKDNNGNTPSVKMRGASGTEYGFLIGTYALCEAFGMTRNPNAREAAEKTLGRIIAGQTATGGWNYNMKRVTTEAPDDISFGGWAMQALKAGKMAGIHLPGQEECIKKAVKCLKTRNYNKKAGFVYRPGSSGGGLGGVGCLAMQLLGYAKDPEVVNALDVMKGWSPTFDKKHMSGGPNSQYYSYYAAQCKYQAGMCKNATPANQTLWKKWNTEMKALYPKSIITCVDAKTKEPLTIEDASGKPRQMGHWVNGDHYNYDVMGTCLAALQLMVYYRYLPTSTLKATEVEADVEALSKDKGGEVGVSIDI